MAPDPEPDDERHGPDDPLPPEDRLWRHPSELAAGITPPAAWFGPTPHPRATAARRSVALSTLAGVCLAGAMVAVGAMWVTRPTQVVRQTPTLVAPVVATTAMLSFAAVPTEQLAAALGPSLPGVRARRGNAWVTGSGVWLDADGTVLTATPLVAGASVIIVTGRDGIGRMATVAGTDPATGITALTVAHMSGTPVTSETAEPRSGEAVAIVGAPGAVQGSRTADATTATAVIRVSSMRSSVADLVLHDTVQLDRAIPSDAVGGVLVDARGRIVGISIGASDERGLGVVTPAADAMTAGTALRDHGTVDRPWLGVHATDLDPGASAMLGLRGGAKITDVTQASPADKCGITEGDVVVGLGGQPIDDATDLVVALRTLHPGATIPITVLRNGHDVTLHATLGG